MTREDGFFLECGDTGRWVRVSDRIHSSAEYAKNELKKIYADGLIERPLGQQYRISATDGVVYYRFYFIDRSGRFHWKLAR